VQTFPAVSYQSAKNLSLVVFGLLAVTIVIEAVNTLLSLGHLYFPYPLELDGGESMSIWIMFIGLIAILQLPIFILTVIFFLIWLHRSYKNLDPLGARHLEHTPGWAVGYWFIPILNLFKPFQVVRDIWNESDPDVDPEMGFLSGGGGTPALLGVWWALWLSSNIIANASSRMGGQHFDYVRRDRSDQSGHGNYPAAGRPVPESRRDWFLLRTATAASLQLKFYLTGESLNAEAFCLPARPSLTFT
jgi:uncharacterized membrane protein